MRINMQKFNLAKARACKGTSDLVQEGIPRGTLCRIGTGSVRPETVGKIARALNVDVTEIIDIDD